MDDEFIEFQDFVEDFFNLEVPSWNLNLRY